MKDTYMIGYNWLNQNGDMSKGFFYYREGKEWADETIQWLQKFNITIESIKIIKEEA